MAIDYKFSVDESILIVQASGQDDNLQEVTEYGMAVIEAGISNNVKHILCDETNLIYKLGTFDTYESAKFIAEYAPKIAKVAIVCNPQCISDAAFWEDVVVNRGLTLKMFLHTDDARKWLVENN